MRLRINFLCFILLTITLFVTGCSNILSSSEDPSVDDKAQGSYSWWSDRANEEQMNNDYNTQFGDQPSFGDDERTGGDRATGITF
ncbi:MAG: hypothetical protein GY756_19275 [bacterium]|nr:hypothetical protein [bacterium]